VAWVCDGLGLDLHYTAHPHFSNGVFSYSHVWNLTTVLAGIIDNCKLMKMTFGSFAAGLQPIQIAFVYYNTIIQHSQFPIHEHYHKLCSAARARELTPLTKLLSCPNYSCTRLYPMKTLRSCGFLSKITPNSIPILLTQPNTNHFLQALKLLSYHLGTPRTI
jgi:hypothetical protein